MVPAGVELFASDAALFGFLPFKHVERETAQGGEVFRCVARAGAALVLAEANLHDPVEFVFNTPMAAAHGAGKGRHSQGQARQIVAAFDRGLARHCADRFDQAHGLEPLPFCLVGKPSQFGALIIAADFKASVVLVHRLQAGQPGRCSGQFGSRRARIWISATV
ncbi:MAG: hypothetical protein JWQ71_1686 [Pedosphaera sp.]|nr:hypothetical protein [Pedosphaera sp.]